jgi:hypothetical protein
MFALCFSVFNVNVDKHKQHYNKKCPCTPSDFTSFHMSSSALHKTKKNHFHKKNVELNIIMQV